MVARTFSATTLGINGTLVNVEASIYRSLPQIHITGLPGNVVKESRERIRACLSALGFDVPSSKIIVHLSPASLKKEGAQFDLAIALCILKSEGHLGDIDISRMGCLGELTLDGRVRHVSSGIALAEALHQESSLSTILLPVENARDCSLLKSPKVRLVESLPQTIDFLLGNGRLCVPEEIYSKLPVSPAPTERSLDEVLGQVAAKRALQIALAGHHHLLMIGPPGVGKSMLAECCSSLLPPLKGQEVIEVAKTYGPSGLPRGEVTSRPYRSPHHTISTSALLGGGTGRVVPGEVSLAHRGILFLDELPEFRRDALEGLREPLQQGVIHLHRLGHAVTLPAQFSLLAAMNPCPCGYALSDKKHCVCTPEKIERYRKKLSGPMLDRIDLRVVLSTRRENRSSVKQFSHSEIKDSVIKACRIQRERYGPVFWARNGEAMVKGKAFQLKQEDWNWMEELCDNLSLSYRGMNKVLRVSRTIADLEGSSTIERRHLSEAWSFRCPDGYSSRVASF